jgi:RES domain-containing protein
VILYRSFVGAAGVADDDPGGALHAPWRAQRAGRHDAPDLFAAYYACESRVGAAAEALQEFRNVEISEADLGRSRGRRLLLTTIEASGLSLIDLDDPRELTRVAQRPSLVATQKRRVTQPFAQRMYESGAAGLRWWSTLEASWINVTLFMDRCRHALRVIDVTPFQLDDPDVATACDVLGIVRA